MSRRRKRTSLISKLRDERRIPATDQVWRSVSPVAGPSEADPLAVHKSLVDAKGDLLVGTAADTVARKAAGTNEYRLVADSAQSDGLRWEGSRGCKALRSSTSAISDATATNVNLNSEALGFDTDAFHDTSTNNDRITIPTGLGGLYLLQAGCAWASNATGYRRAGITVAGTFIAQDSKPAVNGLITHHSVSVLAVLAAADIVRLRVEQTSGGNLNVEADLTWLSAIRIGPSP